MLYIGLDGGGTKTAAVAMDRDGTVLAEARSGGINYNFMPMEDAADNVTIGISPLSNTATKVSSSESWVDIPSVQSQAGIGKPPYQQENDI